MRTPPVALLKPSRCPSCLCDNPRISRACLRRCEKISDAGEAACNWRVRESKLPNHAHPERRSPDYTYCVVREPTIGRRASRRSPCVHVAQFCMAFELQGSNATRLGSVLSASAVACHRNRRSHKSRKNAQSRVPSCRQPCATLSASNPLNDSDGIASAARVRSVQEKKDPSLRPE